MRSSILLSLIFLFGGSFLVSAQPTLGKPDKDFSTDEKTRPKFPEHWGEPPAAQTKDLRPLPGGFGMGSSTLARWIGENLAKDQTDSKRPQKPGEGGQKPGVDRPQPKPRFPAHWGLPPELQLMDHVKLPGNFGMGSSTLAYWIKENIEQDIEKKNSEIKRPEKPKISENLKAKIDAVKQLEKAIHSEIKAQVEALGKEATREDIKATIEAFKERHKQRFDDIKEDHALIKETLKANRPQKPQRPELSVDLKKEVQDLHAKRNEMHDAQKELHNNLKDASKEERLEMIKDFKEANKEKHNDIKKQAKIVKEGIRALAESESGATRTSDL